MHRAAHLWMVTPDGRILLQKRAHGKESHPGRWDVSTAGHLAAGDTAAETAVREAGEELGLVVDPGSMQRICSVTQRYVDAVGGYVDNEIADVYVAIHPVGLTTLRLQAGEVDDVRLVTADELRHLMTEKSTDLVDHAQEYRQLLAWLDTLPASKLNATQPAS